jgi:TrmH family RNA methyltransferase
MLISSLTNARVKQIRALARRKEREQTGLFFVEGIRIVTEAVQTAARIDALVVAPALLKSEHALALVAAEQGRGTSILEVTREVFESISAKEGPQGLGAVVQQHWQALEDIDWPMPGALGWVALDSVQDPGNIGTILRTCDAVGIAGLILLANSADPFEPSAVRASMGAVFTQRLVRATWEEFATWKKQHHIPVVGTSGGAAQDYQNAGYPSPLVLLMGSEREGLSATQQAACDLLVRIPMVGRSDSLNLAVATAVELYEVFNQRRARSLASMQQPAAKSSSANPA